MLISMILALAIVGQPANPGVLLRGTTTVEIASIDPANMDFADLEPLKALIGDARVVVLGEPSHGDGAVFLCKTRLIKFLHEQMGFDVLCWESSMADVLTVNERIKAGMPSQVAFDAIFPIWTQAAQVKPVLEYARETAKTDRPLIQAGFDAQMTAPDSVQQLADRIAKLAGAIEGAPLAPDAIAAMHQLPQMRHLGAQKPETLSELSARLLSVGSWIDDHRAALEEAVGAREVALTRRSVDDASWFMRMAAFNAEGKTFNDDVEIYNERDRRMGANLVWLANDYFKGRKIIVWAATRHMVHRQKEIRVADQPTLYDNMDSAGETAFRDLGDDLYTIGFTALRGEVGTVWQEDGWQLGPPVTGSIEWALDAIEHPYIFLDFRSLAPDHSLREARQMRPLGYGWTTAVWPDQMDAVICIDEMFKSDKNVYTPTGYELTVGQEDPRNAK